ncbi:hypothetical protein HYW21_05490 [Candidatus Woesearchaeota archaeon]|nr:hypothetical protein [Candidatus Woesearchaeota archaeon]
MKPIQTNKGSERSFSQRCVCNKKGIELSVTYLVLLILMIAILGFAFVAVSKMLGSSKESVEAIQARMERQTEQLLTDTNRVSVPIDTQEVAPGELALFSVGVMNVLSSMDMFELNLEFKEATPKIGRRSI